MTRLKHEIFACSLITCLFAALVSFSGHANAQTLSSGQIVTNTTGSNVVFLDTEARPEPGSSPVYGEHHGDIEWLLGLSAGWAIPRRHPGGRSDDDQWSFQLGGQWPFRNLLSFRPGLPSGNQGSAGNCRCRVHQRAAHQCIDLL